MSHLFGLRCAAASCVLWVIWNAAAPGVTTERAQWSAGGWSAAAACSALRCDDTQLLPVGVGDDCFTFHSFAPPASHTTTHRHTNLLASSACSCARRCLHAELTCAAAFSQKEASTFVPSCSSAWGSRPSPLQSRW